MGTMGATPRNLKRDACNGFFWFSIPNKLFEYSGCNKSHIIAVYACLAYHANKRQVSFPSQLTIKYETGISERAVKTTIKVLRGNNIIRVRRIYEKNRTHNKYLLVSPSEWKDQGASVALRSGHGLPPNKNQRNNRRIDKKEKENAENAKILNEEKAKLIARMKEAVCMDST